jgi:hypothetical protein
LIQKHLRASRNTPRTLSENWSSNSPSKYIRQNILCQTATVSTYVRIFSVKQPQ